MIKQLRMVIAVLGFLFVSVSAIAEDSSVWGGILGQSSDGRLIILHPNGTWSFLVTPENENTDEADALIKEACEELHGGDSKNKTKVEKIRAAGKVITCTFKAKTSSRYHVEITRSVNTGQSLEIHITFSNNSTDRIWSPVLKDVSCWGEGKNAECSNKNRFSVQDKGGNDLNARINGTWLGDTGMLTDKNEIIYPGDSVAAIIRTSLRPTSLDGYFELEIFNSTLVGYAPIVEDN